MTGSEKILREEILEPSTSQSLRLSDRWKISTAATQIQREKRTLSEWTSYCMPPSGDQRKQEREKDEKRIWQHINIF